MAIKKNKSEFEIEEYGDQITNVQQIKRIKKLTKK